MGPCKIRRKRKYILILKAVTIIDPVNRWFEIAQYNDKKAMTVVNFVETTWLVSYPWPVEITYGRGGELLGHELKNSLIEQEYGIETKPDSSRNPQANTTTERIHKVLVNLIRTYKLHDKYVDDFDPCMGILAEAAFAVQYMYHRTKKKSPG